MKIKKYIVVLLLLCFCLTGCTSKDSPKDISKATDIELDYFEEKIFEVIIKYEKGEYLTDEDEIDWKKILEDTENSDIYLFHCFAENKLEYIVLFSCIANKIFFPISVTTDC